MLNAAQIAQVAKVLASHPHAPAAWDAWMADIEQHGGKMDAAGARALSLVMRDERWTPPAPKAWAPHLGFALHLIACAIEGE